VTPEQLQAIAAETVTTVELAAAACGMGRTLAYRLARETGELCPGVPVLRVGRTFKVPTRPLLAVLGYRDHECKGGFH
jgi:hypothetical protein